MITINAIKQLRKSKNLTQQQLADKARIHIRLLQKYESSEYNIKNMTLETAGKLAAALDVETKDLLK